MPLADFQSFTTALVRDDTGKITPADRDAAVQEAVKRYSKDRPRAKKQDITADGANKIALPSGWETNFSRLRSIEYPVGNVPPSILEQDRYGLYDDGTAIKLLLLDAVNVGASLRVEYTIAHVLNGTTDTIPPGDREAVCCWAAALLLDQLAAHFAGSTDSTIQADAVEHGSKAREYAARAAALRRRYLNEMGLEDRSAAPAGVQINLDQLDSLGQDRLTHPRRFR
jgi:stage V sporulation protein SpoVS